MTVRACQAGINNFTTAAETLVTLHCSIGYKRLRKSEKRCQNTYIEEKAVMYM